MSSSSLQDLRRAMYVRAKAEPSWRFWGLWVHVCKRETLAAAYQLAKRNNGAPGSDGVSFAAIEEGGVDVFLEQLRTELVARELSAAAGSDAWRSRKVAARCASCRFPRFGTGWSRER